MNSVMIAGGSGFVGANLVKRFKKLGYQIIVLVSQDASLWRLADQLFEIDIIRVDFSNYKALQELIEYHQPGIIINAISHGGLFVEKSVDKIYEKNFDGPSKLLKASLKIGFDTFITLGSSEEYGNTEGQISEETATRPVSDYGVAKTMMSTFALKFAYSQGLPIYVVRPFAVYGAFSPKDKFVGTMFLAANSGSSVGLRSHSNIRDFLYIDDLVDLLMLITQKRPKEHHLFNAGTGIGQRIDDLALKIQESVGKNINVEWASDKSFGWNPKVRFANAELARNVLSWNPRFSIDQGLEQTKIWFENHCSLYESQECLKEVVSAF